MYILNSCLLHSLARKVRTALGGCERYARTSLLKTLTAQEYRHNKKSGSNCSKPLPGMGNTGSVLERGTASPGRIPEFSVGRDRSHMSSQQRAGSDKCEIANAFGRVGMRYAYSAVKILVGVETLNMM